MRLRAIVPYRLADLAHLQGADHPRPQPQRQGQRSEHAKNAAQGQVLKDCKAFVELLQILGEQQQHLVDLPMVFATQGRDDVFHRGTA